MNEAERMRILEMLQEGKISAAEAAELLSALDDRPRGTGGRKERGRAAEAEPARDRPRWFRVRVTDTATGRARANVTIPIGVIGFGMGMARRFKAPSHPQFDDLMEAVRAGRRGTVFDVQGGDPAERVEIIIE